MIDMRETEKLSHRLSRHCRLRMSRSGVWTRRRTIARSEGAGGCSCRSRCASQLNIIGFLEMRMFGP
jgi:hypothetical protein